MAALPLSTQKHQLPGWFSELGYLKTMNYFWFLLHVRRYLNLVSLLRRNSMNFEATSQPMSKRRLVCRQMGIELLTWYVSSQKGYVIPMFFRHHFASPFPPGDPPSTPLGQGFLVCRFFCVEDMLSFISLASSVAESSRFSDYTPVFPSAGDQVMQGVRSNHSIPNIIPLSSPTLRKIIADAYSAALRSGPSRSLRHGVSRTCWINWPTFHFNKTSLYLRTAPWSLSSLSWRSWPSKPGQELFSGMASSTRHSRPLISINVRKMVYLLLS